MSTKHLKVSPTSSSLETMGCSVLTFWEADPIPLLERFSRIRKTLISGHEDELEASLARLVVALRADVEHIECLGAHLASSLEFYGLVDPSQTARLDRDLRCYGVGVVKGRPTD